MLPGPTYLLFPSGEATIRSALNINWTVRALLSGRHDSRLFTGWRVGWARPVFRCNRFHISEFSRQGVIGPHLDQGWLAPAAQICWNECTALRQGWPFIYLRHLFERREVASAYIRYPQSHLATPSDALFPPVACPPKARCADDGSHQGPAAYYLTRWTGCRAAPRPCKVFPDCALLV